MFQELSWHLSRNRRQDLATGSDSISKIVLRFCGCFCLISGILSGPLDRLNAILSLLQPLDRYRAPSAIGSAIGRPYLALSRFPRAAKSSQPPRSKPLRGLNRAIVAL